MALSGEIDLVDSESKMGVSDLTETGESELRGIGEGKAKGKTSTTSEESDLTEKGDGKGKRKSG